MSHQENLSSPATPKGSDTDTIRINLHLKQGVSPSLYASLQHIKGHARAERVRRLASLARHWGGLASVALLDANLAAFTKGVSIGCGQTISDSGIIATSDGTTGGSGSAGAGNQYVELVISGTT